MNIQKIKALLDNDNFTTSYFEATKELPFERLNLIMPTEIKDQLILEMLYSPDIDEVIMGYRLFQYFVRLPFDVEESQLEQIKSLILKINMGIPLMGFGVNEDDRYVYFKSILLIPNHEEISDDLKSVLSENVYMISFIFNRFYPMVKDLASGKISLEKALKKLV
jgi:hypothetical protein